MPAAPLSANSAMTLHPCSEIFPLMEGEDFDALVADINLNGLRDPIVTLGGAILDGRNRHRACLSAGTQIKTVEYTGKDPLGFVMSVNLHRRHLNESQRAMIAARLATMPKGRPELNAQICAFSQVDAARMLRVGRRTVQQATAVRDKGVPELVKRVKRVERGEVAVSVAAKIAELPPDEQTQVAGADEATLRGTAKKSKPARRVVELNDATEKASRELGTKVYCVVYADPPWRFEPYSRDTGWTARPTTIIRRCRSTKSAHSGWPPPTAPCCFFGRPSPCCRRLSQ